MKQIIQEIEDSVRKHGYDQEFLSELSVKCSDRLVKEISKEMKKWK